MLGRDEEKKASHMQSYHLCSVCNVDIRLTRDDIQQWSHTATACTIKKGGWFDQGQLVASAHDCTPHHSITKSNQILRTKMLNSAS